MTGFISEQALISPEARVAASANVSPGAVLNRACEVGEHCEIDAGAILDPGLGGRIVLEQGARIQTGAVVAGPVIVARGALVQAGAVVTRDVPPYAVVAGNPAQIVGYTNGGTGSLQVPLRQAQATPGAMPSSVRGVTLHRLPKVLDLRGNLTVGEFGRSIPFEAKRYFMVFGVPNAEVRGEHAHRTCHQFLICARGSLAVVADDGSTREEFQLDDPSVGIHLPPLTWGVQYKYSPDAVLLVFASEFYDTEEYIRDYAEFTQIVSRHGVA
ncbi:WxcM-like domain-containing protein [Lysobacter rhizosphaerae]